jgi:hypothetical protein
MIPTLIIAGISVLHLIREFITAPEGYEDSDGFHLGRPDGDGAADA